MKLFKNSLLTVESGFYYSVDALREANKKLRRDNVILMRQLARVPVPTE